MTITAAREALRGGETFPHPLETLGEDEIAALAIALDTGGAHQRCLQTLPESQYLPS